MDVRRHIACPFSLIHIFTILFPSCLYLINFDTIFIHFFEFVVVQIVGGEIFPESKQDDDDPLQMGGDFTLNRLPDLLTN